MQTGCRSRQLRLFWVPKGEFCDSFTEQGKGCRQEPAGRIGEKMGLLAPSLCLSHLEAVDNI